MKRYIWLGDSKYGGSVYWDKKKQTAVRNDNTKVSASRSRLGIFSAVTIFICFIILRIIVSFFQIKLGDVEIQNASLVLLSIFWTATITFLIRRAIYGNKNDYIETDLEDAMYAIKSTGYLKNPLIFMIIDKTLNYLILIVVILAIAVGVLQSMEMQNILTDVLKFSFGILFIFIPVYMVYLVHFKKNNRLEL